MITKSYKIFMKSRSQTYSREVVTGIIPVTTNTGSQRNTGIFKIGNYSPAVKCQLQAVKNVRNFWFLMMTP